MLQNPKKTLNEHDLDLQLEETHKLKQCILEFSTRLQQAQERLLADNVSKKIREDMGCTQKMPVRHQRRYNSCQISPEKASRTRGESKENIENIPQTGEFEAKDRRKSDCFNLTGHVRKVSEYIENPIAKFESFQLPIQPSVAFRHFKYILSTFEQGEILEYSEIYFLGLGAEKIKSYSTSSNYGFDDERGDYKIITGDHIGYRYQIMELLGKGSFGQVVRVLDHKTKEFSALKIIKNKARFHEQAQIEVKVLKTLLDNDKAGKYPVVRMKDTLNFRNHTCIIFELLGQSLYQTLKNSGFRGIPLRYIRRYAFQIFQSLHLLSRLKIIHCDLKPENILLSSKKSIKIVDFGSSCSKSSRIFNYIQSRFYRAPEVIFAIDYSESIDVWSIGCILVELYTGVPLFPGENEVDLFNCMIEVLGVPPYEIFETSPRKSMFFNSSGEPRVVMNSKGKKRNPGERPLSKLLDGACLEFIELVKSKE